MDERESSNNRRLDSGASRSGLSDEADVYSQVGEHVAAVIRAAEVAAADTTEQAKNKAIGIRENATAEAARALAEARQKADDLVAKAQQVSQETEAQGRLVREKADEYATERRRVADAQATKMIEAAEQVAARKVQEAREQQQAQQKALELTEAHLGKLIVGLHELTSHLEDLLRTDTEETLESALDASIQTAAGAGQHPE